ncbi:MAG: GTP 3',8-cyclase MoaA [Chlorobi bacterium]|nr:GTP 3',8-cyclase MoaA [Chlorobiota bacterium]
MKLIDSYGRTHDYLRISLTERCNFGCIYCNPNDQFDKSKKTDLMTFEEILRMIELFAGKLEFKKFRFTGGEPLVRKGIFDFFAELKTLKNKYGFQTGITTNGSLLSGREKELKELGIDRLNISLDSLNLKKFQKITKINALIKILDVIDKSLTAGFSPLKVNAVIIKGINDDEIVSFVDYFKNRNVNVRFIEFMPFGGNGWEKDGFVGYKKMKSIIEEKYRLIPDEAKPNAAAKEFRLQSYPARVSFISSISEHFCSTCNRVRVSSTGRFRLCLFSEGSHGINFRDLFRANYTDDEIALKIAEAINGKWEKHPDAENLAILIENNMKNIGG